MNRKIILNLAISLDGYISDEHGHFDWIKGHGDNSNNTDKMFNFPKFVDSVDTIVMGSTSYKDCGIENIENYESKKFFIATSKPEENHDNIEFINGDVCSEILKLKEQEGKDIWLFGGAVLTDAFIKADIVDEYIIGIIPVILGNGRPLFLGNNSTIELHLDECTVQDGITILIYSKRVIK